MTRPGWRQFSCQGRVCYARRRDPSVPSSVAGAEESSGHSGIDFVTEADEKRFLEMKRPTLPTQNDLERMTDAELCRLLARAEGS